jgi:acyl-CoA synthetase (AMP-forming)/AMP-acid ligase II
MPLVQLRLIDSDGAEVECHDMPGEILIKGPNVVPAYLASDQPVQDSDGWLHTGDVGLIRLSEKTGHEHLFIVDRLKDIIKVKVIIITPVPRNGSNDGKEHRSDTHVSNTGKAG